MGGGLRIPMVQATLRKEFGRELSQNINGDEAAALGACRRWPVLLARKRGVHARAPPAPPPKKKKS